MVTAVVFWSVTYQSLCPDGPLERNCVTSSSCAPGPTVSVNGTVAEPSSVVATTENAVVPTVVGMPVSRPPGDRVSPAGSESPSATANDAGPALIDCAVNWWLYDAPTKPAGGA